MGTVFFIQRWDQLILLKPDNKKYHKERVTKKEKLVYAIVHYQIKLSGMKEISLEALVLLSMLIITFTANQSVDYYSQIV